MADIDNTSLVNMYKKMLLIRRFEEKVESLFSGGDLAGTTHACIGQEAVAVGVVSALESSDLVVSNHRGHGHLLAKGGDPGRLMAEFFGTSDGFSQGRGGSQHVACREIGFLGANGITGGGIPIAVGEALAISKQNNDSRIVCCFFGDGAVNQGTFAESLNMAAIWKLPVLFIIENNGWAFSTRVKDGCALPGEGGDGNSLLPRAAAFGISSSSVSGNDLPAVFEAASQAANDVRSGQGPFVLECITYRLCGHSKSDLCEYRSKSEEQLWRKRCPVKLTGQLLQKELLSKNQMQDIEDQVTRTIEESLAFARGGQPLPPEEAAKGVYAQPLEPDDGSNQSLPDAGAVSQDNSKELYGWEAIQLALREELQADPNVILMGEDISEYGGAFKLTRGMLKDFGDGRIINTPISENSIVGVGAGAAMLGMRPVLEMMFADFTLLAFDQIANHAAKFHYMYAGQVNVPLTVRMPTGGYRGYGPTHSQCLEGLFQGVPGLKIVAPSSPRNARALLRAAIRDDNPVLFIEHKLIYGQRELVPVAGEIAQLGQARIARAGSDLSIFAHGYMVTLALRAAEVLSEGGINVEVLDLQTIKPLDHSSILESLSRTMHAVTVEEGWTAGGVGAEVSAFIAENGIEYLDGPVVRVGALDTPIPASRTLENAVLPNPAKIIKAVHKALGV
jgi:2-oxoisovalerate dehydrogenase E1 component